MLEKLEIGADAGRTAGGTHVASLQFGLTQRVLMLIVSFVMLSEVAVFVPSIANFRNNWLRDRLAAARTAALVLEAAPQDMVPEELKRQLLDSVGAQVIVLKMHDTRRLLAVSDMPPRIDETFDLRDPSPMASITAAFRALAAPPGRVIDVVGLAPMGGDFVEITLDETPLLAAMRVYSLNILLLSLAISVVVAGFAAASLNWLVLRPVRRLTTSLIEFGAHPENARAPVGPNGRSDEIGRAEAALAAMQSALVRELAQRKRLAALGLAVAKINHDLRNMLASAQLFSDRLAAVRDPVARRLAPKLMATLDRAIRFCQSTLAYGSAAEAPPRLADVALRPLALDVIEAIGLGDPGISCVLHVADDIAVRADEEHLYRILNNLCRNAREALGNAAGSACITVSARRNKGDVVIEVADTGPGVPAAVRAQLFEAFHGSSRPGGTGLGLAIAADLTRAQGGSIRLLDRSPGATFEIVLPAAGSLPVEKPLAMRPPTQ